MKKIVMSLVLLVSVSVMAHAGFMGDYWKDIRTDSEVHIFDNLTAATFYDWEEKCWLTGGVMSVYQYREFFLDFGVIDTGGPGSPVGGLNYNITKLVKKYIVPDVLDTGLMENLYVGFYGSKDFSDDRWLYGLYTGIKFDFITKK